MQGAFFAYTQSAVACNDSQYYQGWCRLLDTTTKNFTHSLGQPDSAIDLRHYGPRANIVKHQQPAGSRGCYNNRIPSKYKICDVSTTEP